MQSDTSGLSIRKISGSTYVLVDAAKVFPDGPPTIQEIAERLMISHEEVFSSLVHNALNAHAVRKLWSGNVGTADGDRAPDDLAALRTALKIAGTTFTADSDRFPNGTRTPYVAWKVDASKPLAFPCSTAFVKLRRHEREERAKQERFGALKADFERLESMRREIHATALDLYEGVIKFYDEFVEPIRGQVLLTSGAARLVAAVLEFPRKPLSASDLRDLQDLKARAERLETEASKHVLLEPPDEFMFGLAGKRKNLANRLSSLLHDPALVTEARLLVANKDIAPSTLLAELCDTLTLAYRSLAHTPKSDEVERDGREVLEIVASRRFDTSSLPKEDRTGLGQRVRLEFPPPDGTNVASVIVSLIGAGTQTVGELPGPNSLATCMVELTGVLAAPRIMTNPAAAHSFSGRLYRFLVNCAGLKQPQRVQLFLAIDAGDLAAISRVKWTTRFMTGVGWSSAMGIANLAAFFLLARQGGIDLDALGNMTGSAIGGSLGIMQALGRWSSTCRAAVAGRGAAALGAVGAVVMVAGGAYTVKKDLEIGDETGAWIHGAGAAGGAVSVAGMMVAAGAASSATGVGAPVGVALMAIGAVISIGSGAIDIYRAITEPTAKGYFAAVLGSFADSRAYRNVSPLRPALARAFEAVNSRRGIDFCDVTPAAAQFLGDAGFGTDHVSRLIGGK
jgi:hypothetical protein